MILVAIQLFFAFFASKHMGDGHLGKESDLIENKDPFVGLKASDGAPKGSNIELYQGEITHSIVCGV